MKEFLSVAAVCSSLTGCATTYYGNAYGLNGSQCLPPAGQPEYDVDPRVRRTLQQFATDIGAPTLLNLGTSREAAAALPRVVPSCEDLRLRIAMTLRELRPKSMVIDCHARERLGDADGPSIAQGRTLDLPVSLELRHLLAGFNDASVPYDCRKYFNLPDGTSIEVHFDPPSGLPPEPPMGYVNLSALHPEAPCRSIGIGVQCHQ